MEQHNKDVNFILGEFVALGHMVQQANASETDICSVHTDDNLTSFLSNLSVNFPLYCKFLESYEKNPETIVHNSIILELNTVYEQLMNENLDVFSANKDLFLSGYYFQMGLQH